MKNLTKVFHAICSWPLLVVCITILLAIGFGSWVPQLNIDLSLSQRFVGGGEAAQTYEDFIDQFGSEPAIIVVARAEEGRVKSLADELSKLPGVMRTSVFAGRGGKVTAIPIEPDPEMLSPTNGIKLVEAVENVVHRLADRGLELDVTGPLVLQTAAIKYSRSDLKVMTAIALLAIIMILGLSFRSIPGAIAPIAVAAVTVTITLGILALFGVALSQFALIALPVLVGLGVLDSVHIVHAYYESHDLEKTLSKEIAPCFWTSLTTLIGFVVLVISPISQVRSIGLVIAIGVPLSFIASFTFLPSLLVLTSRSSNKISFNKMSLNDPFKRWSDPISQFIRKRKRLIVSVGVVVTVLAIIGIPRLHIDLNFPQIFRSDTPAQESLEKFEEQLGGAASLELILETDKPGGFNNPEVVKKVRSFSQALNLSANVAATISFLNLKDEPSRWLSEDHKKARIHVRMSTARPDLHERFDSALDYMSRSLKDWFSITPTGFGYLYKSMEKVMLKSFIETFAYALIGVMIALLIIARSLRFGFASMLANLMPIAIVLGLMGWMGVGISVGVVILPAVGLGLLADDTIHFLIALKRVDDGDQESVTRAFSSTGWPLVMTQLILLAVFGSLIASHFQSNVLLGIFMCFLLVVGLSFDLLFVPAFVLLWKGR